MLAGRCGRPEATTAASADVSERRRFRGGSRSVIVPVRHLGGERDRLRQRRVRVDRERDVLGVGAHLEREHGLGDQLAGADADDAGAEQPLGARLEQQLRHALVPPERQRAARRRPREGRLLVLDARRALASVSVSPIHATSGSV